MQGAFLSGLNHMHYSILFQGYQLLCIDKLLISNFNYKVKTGAKIAIIGDNGSGKTSLLKAIYAARLTPIKEEIIIDKNMTCAMVPQLINDFPELSGGERFNKALSIALSKEPQLLLLDEPTNHLDCNNKKSLTKLLANINATVIFISHDIELIENCADSIWHVHNQKIEVFHGKYSAYQNELNILRQQLYSAINGLKKAQKKKHQALMQEQQRAKNSRMQGEKHIQERKWPTITSGTKATRAETTKGKKLAQIRHNKEAINDQLSRLWQTEVIKYNFGLTARSNDKSVITINHGACGYYTSHHKLILQNINFNLRGNDKVAICGPNGSGKTTFINAIIANEVVFRLGEWILPEPSQIAYLDQHYANLPKTLSILDYIYSIRPTWQHVEIREFLIQFLFRSNLDVNKQIEVLSGGEQARLSLAAIALQEPKLLILDEITNNIDLTTRNHICQVLRSYQGALIVISHDARFIEELGITQYYDVHSWQ